MIEAGLQNAAEFIDRISALPPDAQAAVLREASQIAEDLRDAADANLSGGVLKSRTGTLRASLLGRVGEGAQLSILVGADAPCGAYQE